MKIVITLENGKVEISIDDNQKQTLMEPTDTVYKVPDLGEHSPNLDLPKARVPRDKNAKTIKPKDCPECLTKFLPNTVMTVFCSEKCQNVAYERDHAAERKAYKANWAKQNKVSKLKPVEEAKPYVSKLNPMQKSWNGALVSKDQAVPLTEGATHKKRIAYQRDYNERLKREKNEPRDPSFKDPWDCLMCRNAGDLCTMHEQMSADGKSFPKYAPHTY